MTPKPRDTMKLIHSDIKDLKRSFPRVSGEVTESMNKIMAMQGKVTGMTEEVTEIRKDVKGITRAFRTVQKDLKTILTDVSSVKNQTDNIYTNMSHVTRDIDLVDKVLTNALFNITSNITDLYEDLKYNYGDYHSQLTNLSDVSQRFDFVSNIWPTLAGHINTSVTRLDNLSEVQEQLKNSIRQQAASVMAEFGSLTQKIDTTVFNMNTESMRKHREMLDTVNSVGNQVSELIKIVKDLSGGTLSSAGAQPSLASSSTTTTPNNPPLSQPPFKPFVEYIYQALPFLSPLLNNSMPLNFNSLNVNSVNVDSGIPPITAYGGIAGEGKITGLPGLVSKISGLFGGFGGLMIVPTLANRTFSSGVRKTGSSFPYNPYPSDFGAISAQWPGSFAGLPSNRLESLIPGFHSIPGIHSIHPPVRFPSHNIPRLPLPGIPGPQVGMTTPQPTLYPWPPGYSSTPALQPAYPGFPTIPGQPPLSPSAPHHPGPPSHPETTSQHYYPAPPSPEQYYPTRPHYSEPPPVPSYPSGTTENSNMDNHYRPPTHPPHRPPHLGETMDNNGNHHWPQSHPPYTTSSPPPSTTSPLITSDTSITTSAPLNEPSLINSGPLKGKCICECPCECICPILPPIVKPSVRVPTNIFAWWPPHIKPMQDPRNTGPRCTCPCICDCPRQLPSNSNAPSSIKDFFNKTTARPPYGPGGPGNWPSVTQLPPRPGKPPVPSNPQLEIIFQAMHDVKDEVHSARRMFQESIMLAKDTLTENMDNRIEELKYIMSEIHINNVAFLTDTSNKTEDLRSNVRKHDEDVLFMVNAISDNILKLGELFNNFGKYYRVIVVIIVCFHD